MPVTSGRLPAIVALLLAFLHIANGERYYRPVEEEDGAHDGTPAELDEAQTARKEGLAEIEELLEQAKEQNLSFGDPDADPSILVRLSNLFAQAELEDDERLDHEEAASIMAPFDEDTGLFDDLVDPDDEEFDTNVDVVADLFRHLDVNGDGRIELEDLLESGFPGEDPSFLELVKQLFKEADEKEEGNLDREGAERFVRLLQEHLPEDDEVGSEEEFHSAHGFPTDGGEDLFGTEEFFSALSLGGESADFGGAELEQDWGQAKSQKSVEHQDSDQRAKEKDQEPFGTAAEW